jgi:hypothetical protein
MTRRPPASISDQRDYAETLASEFEAAPLHNKVWDDLDEDVELARHCDAAAMAALAADRREQTLGEDADYVANVRAAEAKLEWVARQRAVEAVAEVCAELLADADQWVEEGHWSADRVAEAKAEASKWLSEHTNEAARVDVLDVLEDEEVADD